MPTIFKMLFFLFLCHGGSLAGRLCDCFDGLTFFLLFVYSPMTTYTLPVLSPAYNFHISTLAQLRHALAREPRESEIFSALGLDLPAYQRQLCQFDEAHFIYTEEVLWGLTHLAALNAKDESLVLSLVQAPPTVFAFHLPLMKERFAHCPKAYDYLLSLFKGLPEVEQQVLALHGQEQISFEDIAKRKLMDSNDAEQIAYLHAHAILRLRSLLLDQPFYLSSASAAQ